MTVPVLRPYQLAANEKTRELARQGWRRILKQGPCGSGKTNEACELIQVAVSKGTPTLAIVHLRKLVDQFSDRLLEFQVQHGVIMQGRSKDSGYLAQVASRDTLLAFSDSGQWVGLPPAKLVVVDEGRHAVAPQYRRLLKFYEDQGAYIILLDATPATATGNGLGPWVQKMVVSAKTTDLIREKWLVPVRCYAPDLKCVKGRVKKSVVADPVQSWLDLAEDRSTVVFCGRVQHSRELAQAFTMAGVPAKSVDATTGDAERDDAFDALESGRLKVICNVGIIKEGVDLPHLGCVQYFMKPSSRVALVQGASRVMRPYLGKEYGILIDHDGACFVHGFPDEDMDWPLLGNVNSKFAEAQAQGKTAKGLFCGQCRMMYHGTVQCPECGSSPAKIPRSFFAPPMQVQNGLLVEADRNSPVFSDEAKIRYWKTCIARAWHLDKAFNLALALYQKKYHEWPKDSFPFLPPRGGSKTPVRAIFPTFGKRKTQEVERGEEDGYSEA